MRVRAKFYVSSVDLKPGTEGGQVKLQAVGRGARNAEWSQYTPSGSMEMNISNPRAFDQFVDIVVASRKSGRQPEVFIDITDANDGYPGDGHLFELSEFNDQIPEGSYYRDQCVQCGLKKDDVWSPDQLTEATPAHPNG